MTDETKAGGSAAQPPPPPNRNTAAGWAALAIAALAALVDAAIESLWSASPLRWWIAAAVLAFVAIGVWMWRPGGWAARRWGWQGAASWSLAGFLLLPVAAAWLPAAAGLQMMGLDASSLMSLLAALAVVLAVVGIARARILPLPGIVTVAAFGAYAVLAFVMAFHGRTPFHAVIRGAGFWASLPVYLQGAFLGTFLVLPLSLVIEAIGAIRRRPNPWRFQQTVATVVVVAMAASGWPPGTIGGTAPVGTRQRHFVCRLASSPVRTRQPRIPRRWSRRSRRRGTTWSPSPSGSGLASSRRCPSCVTSSGMSPIRESSGDPGART